MFLDNLNEITSQVVTLMKSLPDSDLEWISANRDFGEDERYRAKDEVDESLIGSTTTTQERARVEKYFVDGSLEEQYNQYILRLDHVLCNLHNVLMVAAETSADWELRQHVMFWRDFSPIAACDNAHAMYLSSGNWEFSIFNPIINKFEEWTVGNVHLYNALLTGGIQDIRTSVYSEFGSKYLGMKREAYVRAIRKNRDWQRGNGVLTVMSYIPASGARGKVGAISTPEALAETFRSAVEELTDSLIDVDVVGTAALFQRVYNLRLLYDIYEYFGAYSFLRNLAILRTSRAMQSYGDSSIEQFVYLATTYQFDSAANLIEEVIK